VAAPNARAASRKIPGPPRRAAPHAAERPHICVKTAEIGTYVRKRSVVGEHTQISGANLHVSYKSYLFFPRILDIFSKIRYNYFIGIPKRRSKFLRKGDVQMNNRAKMRRLTSLILALVIALSAFSMTALAVETDTDITEQEGAAGVGTITYLGGGNFAYTGVGSLYIGVFAYTGDYTLAGGGLKTVLAPAGNVHFNVGPGIYCLARLFSENITNSGIIAELFLLS
jgi:hypothetical protein